ncbi:Lrp/AsnC family transcriptional regulator [Candidatus Pacearchaeota archaeon]|nr:Lrp/AsnC family transcriptional regulator [Candidatus Pacearchaeota archaeon]
MEELDKLDNRILYELGEDARQSYKQIAKKINSKKEVVAYHIQQLVKKRIITKFVPVFALSEIGIFSSKIYIRLKGLKKEEEERLYSFLLIDEKIAWIAKSIGNWDLLIGMYSKNIIEFGKIKEHILNEYGKYIRNYDISHLEDGIVFNRDYLIDKKINYRNNFIFGGQAGDKKLSDIEIKTISLIKNNARFTALEIADNLKIDARTVLKILDVLKKKKILQGYTVFIDLKKLGLQLHKLCIYLENYNPNEINRLLETLKQNKRMVHLIKSQGPWELEIEIEESNLENIYNYLKRLRNLFPDFIKRIDLVSITDEMKLDFFPENY